MVKFKVLKKLYEYSTLKKEEDVVYLVEDGWDDMFQYSTMYNVYFYNNRLEECIIGSVKIAQYEMDKENKRRAVLPDEFIRLNNKFFSLGQDSYYYENIKNLGTEMREEILGALRDIAYDKNIFRKAYLENVTRVSLMRELDKQTVLTQFHRISQGGPRLVPYKFNYESYSNDSLIRTIKLEFDVNPDLLLPSNIHVLIGRNGVGKTFLINNMISSIVFKGKKYEEKYGKTVFVDDEIHNESFTKVILVSFSAFDEIKIDSRSMMFARIGLPSRRNQNIDDRNEEITVKFIEGFKRCIEKKYNSLLLTTMKELEYDSIFEEAGLEQYCEYRKFSQEDEENLMKIFGRLSSGHKVIVYAITQLISKVQEKTLIFLDEPEGHLHPPLLAAFIRALSVLLTETNGAAIIATHSPIILQEVPDSCVWVLQRNGRECLARRPRIKTFGQDINSLISEIFGLELSESGFHKLLSKVVNKYDDYETAIKELNNSLGNEGRAVLRTMFVLRAMRNGSNG